MKYYTYSNVLYRHNDAIDKWEYYGYETTSFNGIRAWRLSQYNKEFCTIRPDYKFIPITEEEAFAILL